MAGLFNKIGRARRIPEKLAQLCGFENSDGKFCVEQRFPDGRSKYSIPILDVSQIRLVKEITPIGVYYRVKWKENAAGEKNGRISDEKTILLFTS